MMSAQLTPVAFAGVFLAGCLAIRALQRWSDEVTSGLALILTVVALLLAAQVMAYKLPRRLAASDAKPATTPRLPDRATFDHRGPTAMRATPGYELPLSID